MRKLKDILADKIADLINYMLSMVIIPDITMDKVTELDEMQIIELKEKYGIEGIILDVDNTIRKDMKSIPEINKEWIENIGKHLKVVIVSNGKDVKLEQYFKEKGINYIQFAHKPLKKNFLKACELMGLEPEQVLSVGDDLIDDIYGGRKNNNMKTVLIKSVEDESR